MTSVGSSRLAEQLPHDRERPLEAHAMGSESSRNRRVPIVEQREQEMFGADPVAFEVASLLDSLSERSRGFEAKGSLGHRLGGGADAGQHALEVLRHGAPLEAEAIEHRERNPFTLPQQRKEEMFRVHRAMTALECFLVRPPENSARCFREALEHDRSLG
jgi:hypothetical protein